MHWMRRAASRADCTAGRSKAIKTAMMAITTRSSINVNAERRGFIGLSFMRMMWMMAIARSQNNLLERTAQEQDARGSRAYFMIFRSTVERGSATSRITAIAARSPINSGKPATITIVARIACSRIEQPAQAGGGWKMARLRP